MKVLAVFTYISLMILGIIIGGINAPFMFTFAVSLCSTIIAKMIWNLKPITIDNSYENKKPKYKLGQTVLLLRDGCHDSDRRPLYPSSCMGPYEHDNWANKLYRIQDVHDLSSYWKKQCSWRKEEPLYYQQFSKYSYTITCDGRVVGTVYEESLHPCTQQEYDEYWSKYEPEPILECDTYDGGYVQES